MARDNSAEAVARRFLGCTQADAAPSVLHNVLYSDVVRLIRARDRRAVRLMNLAWKFHGRSTIAASVVVDASSAILGPRQRNGGAA